MAEEVIKYLTYIKVAIPHGLRTLLQVKVRYSKHQPVIMISKSKLSEEKALVLTGSVSLVYRCFQMNITAALY